MKKSCILTFNQAFNYGAVLQMYALQHAIDKINGTSCDVVNYKSDYFNELYHEKTLKDYFDLRFWKKLLRDNSPKRYNVEGFNNFCKHHIRFTDLEYTSQSIHDLNNKYDIYISGSDQVFNPLCSGMDSTFFLDFADVNKVKASYAASLGFSAIPSTCEKYMEMLADFDFLSIREASSATCLHDFLNREDINVNIDPTLLLNLEEWKKLFTISNKIKHKYVLIYAISENKKMLKFAKKIANDMGCKAVYLTDRYLKPLGFQCISGVTPEEWLYLFYNAECIVTNSFHGVAFSINFHKPFFPHMLVDNAMINTRVKDLLVLVGLDYLLNTNNIIDIDYEKVDEILISERRKSRDYLCNILCETEEKSLKQGSRGKPQKSV